MKCIRYVKKEAISMVESKGQVTECTKRKTAERSYEVARRSLMICVLKEEDECRLRK